jgi:hypothetical protein
MPGNDSTMMVSEKKLYYRKKLLQLLDNLERTDEPSMTMYLPVGFDNPAYAGINKLLPVGETIPDEAYKYAGDSRTGAVFFWGNSRKYVIIPPFPVADNKVIFGYDTDGLRQLLNKDFMIAIVIIRLGIYGVGVFRGAELISSKVGTGLVHSRHKKGGSSQRRFERHRAKQIEYFFTNVCNRSREKLEPFLNQIDYVFYCGERTTVDNFIKHCDFMQDLGDRVMPRLLDIRKHGQQGLNQAIDRVWSCQVISWHDVKEI